MYRRNFKVRLSERGCEEAIVIGLLWGNRVNITEKYSQGRHAFFQHDMKLTEMLSTGHVGDSVVALL
jgi:hypothetical protein